MKLQLLVFDDFEVPTHKTKNIVNYVQQMEDSKKLLLVDGILPEKLKLATQNLHYVNVLPARSSKLLFLTLKKCCIIASKLYAA